MAAARSVLCRSFDTHSRLSYLRRLYVQCVSGSTQRLFSSATQKENEVELGDSTVAAVVPSYFTRSRTRQVIQVILTQCGSLE